MAIIEPSPLERLVLWAKNVLAKSASIATRPSPQQTSRKGKAPQVIWTHKLDRERRIECIARPDGLLSFREMKLVRNGPDVFDVPIYESGLYNDIEEITLAFSRYMDEQAQRPVS